MSMLKLTVLGLVLLIGLLPAGGDFAPATLFGLTCNEECAKGLILRDAAQQARMKCSDC